jgi:ferredoxin-thioredoxin reductase catalytic subunit
MKTPQEQHALSQIVEKLKEAVETQYKRVGYYFTPHYEIKKEILK